MNTNLKTYVYIGMLPIKNVKIFLLNECSYVLKFSDLKTLIRIPNRNIYCIRICPQPKQNYRKHDYYKIHDYSDCKLYNILYIWYVYNYLWCWNYLLNCLSALIHYLRKMDPFHFIWNTPPFLPSLIFSNFYYTD